MILQGKKLLNRLKSIGSRKPWILKKTSVILFLLSVCALVGNKYDLFDNEEVDESQARKLAKVI